MPTHKKFFIYFLLLVAFFIFSQIVIHVAINTTYKYRSVEVKSTLIKEAEMQATSINGFAKVKIRNNTESEIENKYLKIACYSESNTLMGTKYIKIDKLGTNEEREFEVRFNFNKVNRAVIDVVEEQALTDENVTAEQKESDPKMGLAAIAAALIILYFI